jgi:hypothetical protein
LKDVTITAPDDLGINFGSGTISNGKKIFTVTGVPNSVFSGNILASDADKGLSCQVFINIIDEQSISAVLNGNFQIGEINTGSIVVTGANGVNLDAITLSQFSINGLFIDDGTIQDNTKTYLIGGTPSSAGSTNIIITGVGVTTNVILNISPAKSLSLSATGSFRAGVASSGTFVITANNGADLTAVSPTSFNVPGLSLDNGTISGTTKTFNVTGTPTSSYYYNIIASNPSSSLYVQGILHVEDADVVEYRANGTN